LQPIVSRVPDGPRIWLGWWWALGGLAGGYGDGCEPYRLPAAMACGQGVFPSSPRRRAGQGRLPGTLGWTCGAGSGLAGAGAWDRAAYTVAVASREAAHLAKVERQIADQGASLRTTAWHGARVVCDMQRLFLAVPGGCPNLLGTVPSS
jgi:hypothetical protein